MSWCICGRCVGKIQENRMGAEVNGTQDNPKTT